MFVCVLIQAWSSPDAPGGAGGGYSIQHQSYITGVGQCVAPPSPLPRACSRCICPHVRRCRRYVLALVRLLQQAKGSLVPLSEVRVRVLLCVTGSLPRPSLRVVDL